MTSTDHRQDETLAERLRRAEREGGVVQITGPAGAGIDDPFENTTPAEPTDPALTGAAIADGLRQLADLIERDALAGRTYPDQAFRVSELVETEQDVLDLATHFGVKVERHGRRTSVMLGFGDGTRTDLRFGPVWNNAVTLHVSHLAAVTE